jgi:serine/threonine protein kinase
MGATTPSIGQVLGHYRIVEQVGAGGMGVVFRAHDEQLDRDVALKILPQVALLSEPARRQFRREALSLARITDPNVTMAFDFGRDDGIDYLVTEYVPGITLDSKLAGRPLPEGEVLNLGKQLASGLETAHREGVIHRDLKPGNLRVTPDGRLKILDFGLAFLLQVDSETAVTAPQTSTYSDAGTLPYMAPEQVKGHKTDARTDVCASETRGCCPASVSRRSLTPCSCLTSCKIAFESMRFAAFLRSLETRGLQMGPHVLEKLKKGSRSISKSGTLMNAIKMR